MKNYESIFKIFFIFLLMFFLIYFISCDSMNERNCGEYGELSFKSGNETDYYCYITTLFRDNSIIFDDSDTTTLVLSFYGDIFNETPPKRQLRKLYNDNFSLINLPKSVDEAEPEYYTENKNDKDVQKQSKYKRTGMRQILVQVPFKGRGVYSSENVYMVLYENGEETFLHYPSSQNKSTINFNIRSFSVKDLTQKDLEKPEYKGLSREALQEIKRVNINGKITGTIPLEQEETNINGTFNFSTIMNIPSDLTYKK